MELRQYHLSMHFMQDQLFISDHLSDLRDEGYVLKYAFGGTYSAIMGGMIDIIRAVDRGLA